MGPRHLTVRFNRRHRLPGHLFAGRYRALVVDSEPPGNFRTDCEYLHLNPARAGLLSPEAPMRDHAWSSFPQYLERASRRWPWLRVDRLFGEMRSPLDIPVGRHEFERQTEVRRHEMGDGKGKEWAAK